MSLPANHPFRPRIRSLPSAVITIAALALGLTACGDDDSAAAADEPPVIEVRAVDFAFEDLPDRVPVGTTLTLVNDAPTELHELVAVRLDDDEGRSADELVSLPPPEMGATLFAEEPAMVLLAAPGAEQVAAVGDGTLAEPGRYLILCIIPTGVEPDVYFAAAAETDEGPPQVDGGPPHIAHGMYTELIVE